MSELRPTPAERMPLHRERRRRGLRCLMIELRETEIDALIRKGMLKAEMRNDPGAVSGALYQHLDRTECRDAKQTTQRIDRRAKGLVAERDCRRATAERRDGAS